jgi:selenocysteine-specific elongation factor
VVATAGHVDHGKSTLVRALTGTDPDRWDEEKRRGLTIDLGFAWTTLASGRRIAIVDVPGHVRFLRNMLAGVGAVDACLFVVAASEGWKPQSEEHLRILDLLGLTHGVVALTKIGLFAEPEGGVPDPDLVELARLEVADRLAGTFLAGVEIVAVDTPTGVGLGQLRLALDRVAAAVPVAGDAGRARLWVDRCFATAGAGTVITGTLTGGALAVDDEVEVVGPTAGRRTARIRGLRAQGDPVGAAGPGNRVAVALAGVAHRDIARGDALVHPGTWHVTTVVDASLRVLDALDHDVSRRGAWLAYLGSGEHPATVRVLGPERLAPGEEGSVRLHVPHALALAPGDRFVLRESGRGETVGGGAVLDVEPVVPASRARPDRDPARVVAERGWVEADHLARLLGAPPPSSAGTTVGRWVVAPAALAAAADELRAGVAVAGALGLDVAALDDRARAVLGVLEGVVVAGGRATEVGTADPLAAHPYLAALAAAPFAPPAPEAAGVGRAELRALVQRGLVVESDGHHFAPEAVAAAARAVAALLVEHPDGVTVSDVRDALATSRKHALPLLAVLDATGVTRRRGDLRVGGPRLPAPD